MGNAARKFHGLTNAVCFKPFKALAETNYNSLASTEQRFKVRVNLAKGQMSSLGTVNVNLDSAYPEFMKYLILAKLLLTFKLI